MHSVCRCSLPVWRRSFLNEGTPVTYFGPALDPPLGDLAEKQQHLSGTMSTSSLPSFIKIHQAVLEKKWKMWKVYGQRRTDGRTTDDALWQQLTRAFGSGELKKKPKQNKTKQTKSKRKKKEIKFSRRVLHSYRHIRERWSQKCAGLPYKSPLLFKQSVI